MQHPLTAATPPTADHTNRRRGIALMIVAVSHFACLDAIAKYLLTTGRLPATEVVWMRFLGAFLIVVFMLGAVRVPELLRARRIGLQLLRSGLLLASTLLNFVALRSLRLDQTITIQFLAPLLVALLAGPILGEWVGWRRLIAIVVGFGGIVVVIRPGYASFDPALLLALGCMACYACFILVTRYLAAHDRAEVTMFYSLIAGTNLMAPPALVDWTWPAEPWHWALLLSIGVIAAHGHYIFILAHRAAPATAIAPFMYTQILIVVTVGYLVFGDLPDLWTAAGSAIIIASGVYLWHRERVVAERDAPASPARGGLTT